MLEVLPDTRVSIRGRDRRLLEEVDWISGVSCGSFTAAYHGLFRDRIFQDFNTRFLKKNIQGDLTRATLFNPINWTKLFSAYYDRSDLVDGRVADNPGLRAILERVTLMGDPWTSLKYARMENVHKIVFVVVNAETEINDKWDRRENIPPFGMPHVASSGIQRNSSACFMISSSIEMHAGGFTGERRPQRSGRPQPDSFSPLFLWRLNLIAGCHFEARS